ncbi:MAG: MFS transporter [Victivallales bacterium]|nr:MFS transporter [Victivallales bacterium]
MIYDRPLTDEQRRVSQLNYNLFNIVNGASYMCLGETVIILFAVKLHAPNVIVAVIGSMLFLGFLLLPLGVVRTAQVGAARSQADFWVCRNVAALLVAVSALIQPLSQYLAWGLLLLGSFLFYGFRAAGVVMSQPLIGDITNNMDRARLIARSTGLFYVSGLVAMVTISLILGHYDSLWVLVGIIVAGACCGVTASTFVRKIDETSAIRRSAQAPLFPQLKTAFFDSTLRRQICAGFMVNLAIIMMAPIAILTMKRGYGVSDTQAILFSIVQFASSIAATQISGKITEKIGPRKVAIYSYMLIFPICLFWLFAPAAVSSVWMWGLFALPFILIGAMMVSAQNAMVHYFLMAVPKERQVASSMFISVVTGAAAGVTGMFVAGGLLKLAERFLGSGLPMYRAYFVAAGVLFLAGLTQVVRLVPVIDAFLQEHGMEKTRSVIREVVHHK